MSKIDRLRKQNRKTIDRAHGHLSELDKMTAEANRVANIARDVHIIIQDLDKQFESVTGLDKTDIKFLLLATALQCVRQYVLTKFPERMDDQTAAKNTWGHIEEHSNRIHRYYNPSLEEIITNPVPFDANIRDERLGSPLAGGGKLGHRVTALGHDSILGLVFGTSNIATSTLTNNRFQSYHVATNENQRDYMKNRANTALVLSRTKEKLLKEDLDGKKKVAWSLVKEIIHLKSDIGTKHSLPLPIMTVVNPQIASDLAVAGLDMANIVTVGKQMGYSVMVNSFIAMVHSLFYDESLYCNKSLYTVKTRKILSYSNTIATTSNIIVTGFAAYAGVSEFATQNFDVGGLLVTLHRIINDQKYIKEIKQEFLEKEFYKIVMG